MFINLFSVSWIFYKVLRYFLEGLETVELKKNPYNNICMVG